MPFATVLYDVSDNHDKFYIVGDNYIAYGSTGFGKAIGVSGARGMTVQVRDFPKGKQRWEVIDAKKYSDASFGYIELASIVGLNPTGYDFAVIAENTKVLMDGLGLLASLYSNLKWAEMMLRKTRLEGDTFAFITAEQAMDNAKSIIYSDMGFPLQAVDGEGKEIEGKKIELSRNNVCFPEQLFERRFPSQ